MSGFAGTSGGFNWLDGGFGASGLANVLFAQRAADFNAASLALSNGASISSWPSDVSPSTYTATQTGTNRPTYSATGWSDGGPCISAVAASKQAMACDALAALMASGRSWGVASLVRRSGTNEQMLFGADVGGAVPYQYGGIQVTDSVPHFLNNGTTYKIDTNYPTYSDSDSLIIHSYNAGTLTVWIDGYVQQISIGATSIAHTKAMILSLPFNATGGIHPSCWNGKMRRQVWYGRALANHDYAAIEQKISALYVRRRRPSIYGDSRAITSAWPTNLFGSITVPPYWMDPSSNTEAGWHSYAVPGYTCVDVLASLTSNGIYTKYVPGRPFAHMPACGCNDPWVDGVDGPTTLARYWAIHDALATNNPNDYRVAFTIPQRNDQGVYPIAQVSAAIEYANAGIRAEWQQHCHALVDVVALQPKFNNPDSDYYNGSGVHFSDAGNAAFASCIPIEDIMNAAAQRVSSLWLVS